MTLEDALSETPVIAIIRGVTPENVEPTAAALLEAGVRVIEVPLNSPQPMESIEILSRKFAGRLVSGAGTVMQAQDVDRISELGGEIIVSPHVDRRVIGRAVDLGLTPFPGVFTPTEAFAAIEAGARRLKLFPASSGGPAHLKAIKTVLPKDVTVYAVGGVRPEDMSAWREAGASGFGLGSELYRPGQSPEATFAKARQVVEAARKAFAT